MLGFVMKAAGEWFSFDAKGGSYKVKKSGNHKWDAHFRPKYDQPFVKLNAVSFTSKTAACRCAEEHHRRPR